MFKNFLRSKPLPTIEKWSQRHANKASPDGMIAAVIVESLAKHWEDWKASGLITEPRKDYYSNPTLNPMLKNDKKNIVVEFGVKHWDSESYHFADWQSEGTKVNGIEIELKAARHIASEYERLNRVHVKLQETAAKAKAAMEKNEAKWNLAEQLLGFKRNENGALVPAQTAEA